MTYEFDSDLNLGEYWISSNIDKNLEKNYTQAFNNVFDFEIPIFNEFPGLEIAIMEKSSKAPEGNFDIISRKRKLFKTTSRGRKSEIGQAKIHKKAAKDNILRKVNVCFLNFVIELANIIVTYFGFKGKFIDLEQNFKTNITKKLLKKLKSFTFEQLLSQKNSKKKNRKHSSNENEIFCKEVIKNENIKEIFSEKYMTILAIILKSQRNIKVGGYNIYLPPTIKMFDSFLLNIKNKYKNDDSYIERIQEVIQEFKEEYLVL
jgi:hypothetical protein